MEEPIQKCVICFNSINENEVSITNCNHIFCLQCILRWFNQGKISCPSCRSNVVSFTNDGRLNHIIKVKERTNDTTLEQNFRRIYNQNVFFKFIIGLNIVYSLYSMYADTLDEDRYYYYRYIYQNCSNSLSNLNDRLINYQTFYDTTLYDILNKYSQDYVEKCFYPLTYLNHCLI